MSTLDLTLKPAQIEMVAKPGAAFTQAYLVTNNSDSSLVLTSSVLPWLPVGADGSLTYDNVPANPDFSFTLANSDLRLGQSFLLRPGQSRQLVLKVKSDPNASLSDGYFTFFISEDMSNTLNPDGNLSAATGRLGSHLLISTADSENVSSQAAVTGLSVSPRLKDIFFPQLQIQAKITNRSAYFFKAAGQLTITKNNLIISELDLFPQNVLASASRSVSCNSGNLPVPCAINPPFWPGKYTATLTLDPSLAAAPASISFYVFPYSFLLLIVLIAASIYAFARLQPKP